MTLSLAAAAAPPRRRPPRPPLPFPPRLPPPPLALDIAQEEFERGLLMAWEVHEAIGAAYNIGTAAGGVREGGRAVKGKGRGGEEGRKVCVWLRWFQWLAGWV